MPKLRKCVICKNKFEPETDEPFCSKYECESKFSLQEKINRCEDPVVRGRLRDTNLESMRLGTAWAIRKKSIPKYELLRLRKKFEPERYGIVPELPSRPNVKRRPRGNT